MTTWRQLQTERAAILAGIYAGTIQPCPALDNLAAQFDAAGCEHAAASLRAKATPQTLKLWDYEPAAARVGGNAGR